MKVKIRKALQIKNRLTGEIARLNSQIQTSNQYIEDQPKVFNAATLLGSRQTLVSRLIAIKTAISIANVAIYEKIAKLAELKDEITLLRSLRTNESVDTKVVYGTSNVTKEVKTKVDINAIEVETFVSEKEKAIEALQDEIDYFNNVTEIEIPE